MRAVDIGREHERQLDLRQGQPFLQSLLLRVLQRMTLGAEDLAVSYGPIEAVRGISVTLPRGGIVAIVGANGAGKSTTIRALAGELRPWRGTVTM